VQRGDICNKGEAHIVVIDIGYWTGSEGGEGGRSCGGPGVTSDVKGGNGCELWHGGMATAGDFTI
jgi:hypothetical protein